MNTRNTLEMARFFLNMLKQTEGKTEYLYYLYAFTVGWRTVFDALLSDLADYYGLTDEIYRLSRVFRWAGMNTKSFFLAAHQRTLDCGDSQIEETANWLSEKFSEIAQLRISADRNSKVHGGVASGTILPPIQDEKGFHLRRLVMWQKESPKIKIDTKKCQEAFLLMESIVNEAEKKGNISLS